ncbi:MAG: hypothetical protein L6R42_003700 [Xanthoria sp. 1 TBL-2021]|nr:MAG: hypothetical protein L6R42_003700 [Xanthoria sp. 1 TBL-2021]
MPPRPKSFKALANRLKQLQDVVEANPGDMDASQRLTAVKAQLDEAKAKIKAKNKAAKALKPKAPPNQGTTTTNREKVALKLQARVTLKRLEERRDTIFCGHKSSKDMSNIETDIELASGQLRAEEVKLKQLESRLNKANKSVEAAQIKRYQLHKEQTVSNFDKAPDAIRSIQDEAQRNQPGEQTSTAEHEQGDEPARQVESIQQLDDFDREDDDTLELNDDSGDNELVRQRYLDSITAGPTVNAPTADVPASTTTTSAIDTSTAKTSAAKAPASNPSASSTTDPRTSWKSQADVPDLNKEDGSSTRSESPELELTTFPGPSRSTVPAPPTFPPPSTSGSKRKYNEMDQPIDTILAEIGRLEAVENREDQACNEAKRVYDEAKKVYHEAKEGRKEAKEKKKEAEARKKATSATLKELYTDLATLNADEQRERKSRTEQTSAC